MIGTFKKLSYEKKLCLYFSLLTTCFKNIFRSEFQIKQIEKVISKVYFLKGNNDHLCLVRMPNICGVCG